MMVVDIGLYSRNREQYALHGLLWADCHRRVRSPRRHARAHFPGRSVCHCNNTSLWPTVCRGLGGQCLAQHRSDFRACDLHDASRDGHSCRTTLRYGRLVGFRHRRIVDGPPPNERNWGYLVTSGCSLMVQTYALDIMALAMHGWMTPLRLWRLAMQQRFEGFLRPWYLEGVDYGEITRQWK